MAGSVDSQVKGPIGCGAAALFVAGLFVASLAGCGGSDGVVCSSRGKGSGACAAASTAAAPSTRHEVDYLVLVPRAFQDAMVPLVALREREGHGVVVRTAEDVYAKHPGAARDEALLAEAHEVASANPSLHFLLLAGDPRAPGAELPTFHPKLGAWVGADMGSEYASDQPFALFAEHPLAVGRLPARTRSELEGMVSKVIAYESAPAAEWSRRVLIFGGPASFDAKTDAVIEGFATSLLDSEVPHDFDLGVVFAQATSPYAVGFDRLGAEMSREMSEGALLAVFAGHGSPQSFDHVTYRGGVYPIGEVKDFASIDARRGAPIFIAITCSAGAFDRRDRSIVETAMLNARGPVASFGAAAFSGAYVNILYSEELLHAFLVDRLATVGDAILSAKRRLPEASSIIKYALGGDGEGDMATSVEAIREHLSIYNLFGDPATRPRYTQRAELALDRAVAAPGVEIVATVTLPQGGFREVEVTLETERTHLKEGILPPAALDLLDVPDAFRAMNANHSLAIDKVVSRTHAEVAGRRAVARLTAPREPGTYWVRVIAASPAGAATASGHLEITSGSSP